MVGSGDFAASGGDAKPAPKAKTAGRKTTQSEPQKRDTTPLQQLRVRRCFTVEQLDYQNLLSALENTFRQEASKVDALHCSDHAADSFNVN